jgi:hypothetical protein
LTHGQCSPGVWRNNLSTHRKKCNAFKKWTNCSTRETSRTTL